MSEIELRFQIPDASVAAVEAAVAKPAVRRTRLQANYFDTHNARLARAGLALRLRKEGARWIQTLKGGGPSAIERFEHNVELLGCATNAALRPDPALHSGTDGGELLAFALAPSEGEVAPELELQFRTDVWRRRRVVRAPGGTVEIAFDRGFIIAGEVRLAICELEVELLRGSPGAMIRVARRWVERFGLWLEVRSKAERGARLASSAQASPAEPRHAGALRLDVHTGNDAASRAAIANCLDHILPNASEIASGVYSDEHLHQLRVGLRRLGTALRFFESGPAPIESVAAAVLAAVFTQLGTTRDRDAIAAAVIPDLVSAGAPCAELPSAPRAGDPAALARSWRFTLALLDLLGIAGGYAAANATSGEVRFRDFAVRRLDEWHERVRRDAKRFGELDDAARHRLRRRVKRLRYAAEFASSLYDAKPVARYLKRLAPAQDLLGELNDVIIAQNLYRGIVEQEPGAWFAVGRLSAKRDALLTRCAQALNEFRRAKPFWKSAGH